MDLSQETEDFLRESVEYTLGLPVSTRTLQLKVRASEEAQQHLKNQYHSLQSKLKEKEDLIELARSEATLNAQAVKKFVEENQKLAAECMNLLGQCKKWERECKLYERDREALMDFGNEADERAMVAESRVAELKEEVKALSEELQSYKYHSEAQSVGTSSQDTAAEQTLLDSLLAAAIGKDEYSSIAHSFLTVNSGNDYCEEMLKLWNRGGLSPVAQKVLALMAEFKSLENDKDHLRVNLNTAEDEVNVLFEQNKILDEENKKLMRQLHREKHMSGSGGKHSASSSTKGNKRKCSPKLCSDEVEKKIDFGNVDAVRLPLSPLQCSPERRMLKK
ncbi:OLC1v1017325C1 [Oldenlandia corymbosa var. corymbosa]|uniref:OLC1v1017325C1 n=1 Tax=Oldenlandia corymbosa var. corymbosa TaxID=529605 RepID=A0AAV1E958_OLDCO|nr:OLC1v1017325C1 [Oldenlandia corymbosa var. corymbosa]